MEQKQYVKTVTTVLENDVAGDHILPDSYPDVSTVVSCIARIGSLKRYYGANDAEQSGSVVYDILFTTVGENGERLCTVSFTDDFKHSCRYRTSSDQNVVMQTKVRETGCRMANPRKFSLRAVLETLMYEQVVQDSCPVCAPDMNDDANIQYKWAQADTCRVRNALLTEHSFSDNIELEMKLPEIDEIVFSSADIRVRDERSDPKETRPKLSGVLCLALIYRDKSGEYHTMNKDINFGISLTEDEAAVIGDISDPSCSVLASVYISAMNVNLAKNGFDEARIIEFDADYDIELTMITGEKAELAVDAYSTSNESECKYESVEFDIPATHVKSNMTFNDTSAVSVGDATLVCVLSPEVCELSAKCADGSMSIVGKLKEKCVFASNGRLIPVDATLPFTFKTNIAASEELLELCGMAYATDNRVRYDNDKLYADCELFVDAVISTQSSVVTCKAVTLGERVECDNDKLFIIYYPNEDESLWETAKRKKTTVERIRSIARNADSPAGAPLIIE